jgi:hypothetical protein
MLLFCKNHANFCGRPMRPYYPAAPSQDRYEANLNGSFTGGRG